MGDNLVPLIYSKYAEWWPLLSTPDDDLEESQVYTSVIMSHCKSRPATLLELGSGGGNNAAYMKSTFQITLVDLSDDMLRISRRLNPECAHFQGDMREVDLHMEFDAVFIHDAISHMVTRSDLQRAMKTAYRHCRKGGVCLLCPDQTRESFRPDTDTGGSDLGDKGLRFLEWRLPDDEQRSSYSVYMTCLFRDGKTITQGELDSLRCGLFSQEEWLTLLSGVGFEPIALSYPANLLEDGGNPVMFLGMR